MIRERVLKVYIYIYIYIHLEYCATHCHCHDSKIKFGVTISRFFFLLRTVSIVDISGRKKYNVYLDECLIFIVYIANKNYIRSQVDSL